MTTVFAIVHSQSEAASIVAALRELGTRPEEISILFPDKSGQRDFAHEQHTKAPEGATGGGVAGGVLGGALGWLAGIGMLAIPGVGPFIAAGPIMAALGGAALGATVGGITGALIGMGVPEFEAKAYEGKIRSGNVLLAIHTDGGAHAKQVRESLENMGATDIRTGGEAAVPRVEVRPTTPASTLGTTRTPM